MNAPLLRIADNRAAEDNVVTYFSEVYYVLTYVRVESHLFCKTMMMFTKFEQKRAREVMRES